MDIKIDDIVKQVLSEVKAPSMEQVCQTKEEKPSFTGNEKGKTAILTAPETYEIKEYPLPEIGGKEILVRVEGCMVSLTDVAEFLKEKRVGQATVLGQQGTGVIVKVGSSNLKDAKGNVLSVGDRVVVAKKSTGAIGTYGGNRLGAGVTANGWFSNYVAMQAGNQVYQVNDLDQESCLLTETVLAVKSAVDRSFKLNKLDSTKRVIVLGCGIEGLITLAILKSKGIDEVLAMGGTEEELKYAEAFGAKYILDYREKNGVAGVQDKASKIFRGNLADAVFQCTPYAMGKSVAKRLMKNSGYVCELGYVLGYGKATTKYYEDTRPVGARFYSTKDYEDCFELLKTVKDMKIPMYKLITHRYMLEEINEAHWMAIREEGMGIAVFNR